MHRKQRLTRSPPSARVSSGCGMDGQQRCIDYSHRAGPYSARRRPNLQLRRQTDQRRRNGWHELAGHDRTMQLFMAFACLEGLARTIGIRRRRRSDWPRTPARKADFHPKLPCHPVCQSRSAMPPGARRDAASSTRRAAARPSGRTASRRERSPRW